MLRFFFFSLFLLLPFGALKASSQTDSLLFRTLSYEALLGVMQQKQRPIMLYFHFDGCGGCVVMEKNVFSNDTVRSFLTNNFELVEVNTLEKEGKSINEHYQIKMHPSFLFLSPEGTVIHRYVGVCAPQTFIEIASNALLQENTLNTYQERYKQGERSLDFLYEYIKKLDDAYFLDSIVVNEYLNLVSEENRKQKPYMEVLYKYCFHRFNLFTPYGNPHFQYMLQHRKDFENYFNADQIAARLVWILNFKLFDAIEQEDKATFLLMKELIRPLLSGKTMYYEPEPDIITAWIESATLLETADLYFYEKVKELKPYKSALKQLKSKAWDNDEALNTFAWSVYENWNGMDPFFRKPALKTALKCSKRSLLIENTYSYNDTFASLLFIKGKKKKALKKAKYAIELAKKENTTYDETARLIEQIENAN